MGQEICNNEMTSLFNPVIVEPIATAPHLGHVYHLNPTVLDRKPSNAIDKAMSLSRFEMKLTHPLGETDMSR